MNEFEAYLDQRVNEFGDNQTKKAMCYSLLNGGKRFRPQLLFALLKDHGIDEKVGYPCACAIEMIHTYSLIHDDLPAMDNDDLRRGKPSCHKAFNEAIAILAGDGLLTKAFEVVCDTNIPGDDIVKIIRYLAQYAGVDGMIYGQTLDLENENNQDVTYDVLIDIDNYKTSKLLTLPLICACIIAKKHEDIDKMIKIGYKLGILFQMQDDILDVTSSSEVLGKSTSDEENAKVTVVSMLGLETAKEKVSKLAEELCTMLSDYPNLYQILESIINRKY